MTGIQMQLFLTVPHPFQLTNLDYILILNFSVVDLLLLTVSLESPPRITTLDALRRDAKRP